METWTVLEPISLFYLTGIPCLIDTTLHLPPSCLCINMLERTQYLTFILCITGTSRTWTIAHSLASETETENWCLPQIVVQSLAEGHLHPYSDPSPENVAFTSLESINPCHIFSDVPVWQENSEAKLFQGDLFCDSSLLGRGEFLFHVSAGSGPSSSSSAGQFLMCFWATALAQYMQGQRGRTVLCVSDLRGIILF